MQFINIVVHSVEDMNFRVHLQYDFTKLNLDDHLEVTFWEPAPNFASIASSPTNCPIASTRESFSSCPPTPTPVDLPEAEAHGERQITGADTGLPGQRV